MPPVLPEEKYELEASLFFRSFDPKPILVMSLFVDYRKKVK